MRPTIRIRPLTAPPTGPAMPVAALILRRSLAWPVGQAEADLSPAVEPPQAGDEVVIEGASDGGSLRPLFTGRVLRSRRGIWGSRLLMEEATGPLARLYMDKQISSGTAAQVVSDLCQEAGVKAMAEAPGAQLPSLALLSSRSALEHILRLGRLSGWLVRTDVNGMLRAETPLPVPSGVMLRPEDPVLSLGTDDNPDEPAGGALSGDGAFGLAGPGAETWVLQSISGMTAGDGQPAAHLPALKTIADVTKAATIERLTLAEGRHRRTLTMAGAPPADLGEVLLLSGFPAGDGLARVISIEMAWSARDGLLTRLDLHKV